MFRFDVQMRWWSSSSAAAIGRWHVVHVRRGMRMIHWIGKTIGMMRRDLRKIGWRRRSSCCFPIRRTLRVRVSIEIIWLHRIVTSGGWRWHLWRCRSIAVSTARIVQMRVMMMEMARIDWVAVHASRWRRRWRRRRRWCIARMIERTGCWRRVQMMVLIGRVDRQCHRFIGIDFDIHLTSVNGWRRLLDDHHKLLRNLEGKTPMITSVFTPGRSRLVRFAAR